MTKKVCSDKFGNSGAARKEKFMKIFMITLSLLVNHSLAFARPGDGVGAGGGGFMNYLPQRWIKKSVTQLTTILPFVPESYFTSAEHKGMVIGAVKNIKISPEVSRQRDGKELILDFDLNTKSIEVLKGFFDKVSIASKEEDMIPVITDLILHEAGHLIGFVDDDSAETFSQTLIPLSLGTQPFTVTIANGTRLNAFGTLFYTSPSGIGMACDPGAWGVLDLPQDDPRVLLKFQRNECRIAAQKAASLAPNRETLVMTGIYIEKNNKILTYTFEKP